MAVLCFLPSIHFWDLIRGISKINLPIIGNKCESISDKLGLLPGKSPKYPGYGPGIWGLTASDNPTGYGPQSPTNDLGVITPTAAISAIPYTPAQSLTLWKQIIIFLGTIYGVIMAFYDAFDVSTGWWANSSLAIDEGPIIGMIWKLQDRTSMEFNSCLPGSTKRPDKTWLHILKKMKNLRLFTLFSLIIFGVIGCVRNSDKATVNMCVWV